MQNQPPKASTNVGHWIICQKVWTMCSWPMCANPSPTLVLEYIRFESGFNLYTSNGSTNVDHGMWYIVRLHPDDFDSLFNLFINSFITILHSSKSILPMLVHIRYTLVTPYVGKTRPTVWIPECKNPHMPNVRWTLVSNVAANVGFKITKSSGFRAVSFLFLSVYESYKPTKNVIFIYAIYTYLYIILSK